jgi:hypothetical protein
MTCTIRYEKNDIAIVASIIFWKLPPNLKKRNSHKKMPLMLELERKITLLVKLEGKVTTL